MGVREAVTYGYGLIYIKTKAHKKKKGQVFRISITMKKYDILRHGEAVKNRV